MSSTRSSGGLAAGVTTILATVFAMALTDAFIKHSSLDMTLWQIYVLRSLLVVPILFLLVRRRAWPAGIGWVLLRSLALTAMYLGIYGAIPLLDLSVIAAALYTGPLFIVALSALFLREAITLRQWGAILLGFLGVMLVVRPPAAEFDPLSLLPVGAAFLYALAAVLTRAKCSGIPAMTLALWLNAALLVSGAAASLAIAYGAPAAGQSYPFLFGDWQPMDGRDYSTLAILAALMTAVSIGLAKAYQSPRPQVIATFDYAYLIFAAFWGFVFFGEIPGRWTLAGMALIALAGAMAILAGPRPAGGMAILAGPRPAGARSPSAWPRHGAAGRSAKDVSPGS